MLICYTLHPLFLLQAHIGHLALQRKHLQGDTGVEGWKRVHKSHLSKVQTCEEVV